MRTRLYRGSLVAVASIALAACATEPTMVAGLWSITETINATACGDGTFQETYNITVMQNGSDITVDTPAGMFTGQIDGNEVNWEGVYFEDGGTVTTELELTINGSSLSGSATWTWSDVVFSCSGTSVVTGVRTGGG